MSEAKVAPKPKTWRTRLKKILFSFLRIYILLLLALVFFQRQILYPAPSERLSTESQIEHFAVDGADLILTREIRSTRKALVYFGGNAEDPSAFLGPLGALARDRSIFLMHYRGYCGSTGDPTEDDLQADAAALIKKLQPDYEDILVIGRSLGSGVAIKIAAEFPVSGLILMTPYDSIAAVAKRRFFMFPVDLILKDPWISTHWAPKVTAKTLIIVAENDTLIPNEHSRNLAKEFTEGLVTFKTIAGSDHNSIGNNSDTWAEMSAFLQS